MKQKILIILHQAHSTPGRIGKKLLAQGYELDIVRPPMGDKLPTTLQNHYGVIMFGGPMSVNDNEDFIKQEIDWISVPLKEEKPFWGICLGAQKLAKNLGGKVQSHKQEKVEVGYYPITPTIDGKALMEWPPCVYQWHRQGFDLPKDSVLLAKGDLYPNQAFRFGKNAYGMQFHSELTWAMMIRWTIKAAHMTKLPSAKKRHQHIIGRIIYDKAVEKWLDDFLKIWLDKN